MIRFEEELKKYLPEPSVDEASAAIQQTDLTDMTDIMKELMREYLANNGGEML